MSWLSAGELEKKLIRNSDEKTANAFYGIHAMDMLPEFIPHYPFLMIVNTHTHNLGGEHWLCVFINKEKCGELFDSLSMPPNLILSQWLNRFTRQWRRNHLMYQHPMSATCGAYVLYFCLNRLNYDSFDKVLRPLTKYPHVNDIYVLNFFKSLE